jgi:hypothetical protein
MARDSEYLHLGFFNLHPIETTGDMKKTNSNAAKQESNIQCVEVLIATTSLPKNLRWTLSVYSLENNPVSPHPAIHNCEVYHFMIFDWRRTVRQLLENHPVPYSVIQYFSARDIHAGVEPNLSFDENAIHSALDQIEETYGASNPSRSFFLPSSFRHEDSGLISDERTFRPTNAPPKTPAAR